MPSTFPERTEYPQPLDLEAFLLGAGIIESEMSEEEKLISLPNALAMARKQWEEETGWLPFLPDSEDTTRYFTPQGAESGHRSGFAAAGGSRTLYLSAGLVSLTTLTTGLTYDETGAPTSGTVRVVNRDFVLMPLNAPAEGMPYEWIEFYSPLYGGLRSVQIVGRFGYGMPEDAWSAILRRAAMDVLPQLEAEETDGLLSLKIGQHEFKFNPNSPYASQIQQWTKFYNRVMRLKTRDPLGLL